MNNLRGLLQFYKQPSTLNRWLLIIACLFLHLQSGAQKNFYWEWQLLNDSVHITGKIKGSPSITLKLAAGTINERFAGVYQIIDGVNHQQSKQYKKTVRELSDLLVKPFLKQIASCHAIVVTIDSPFIRFPLEFLMAGALPVALVRPLVFQIKQENYDRGELVRLKKGLIIRDPTADPDDACATTFSRYPGSTYRSAYHVIPKKLEQKQSSDFLLVSTHGFVDSFSGTGRILFNDLPFDSTFFHQSHFKLVYLDACQQGINWSYLSAISKNREPSFYLGPIISNDSGESSTKTINWFFSALEKTNDPVKAIWQTRNLLFNHYHKTLNAIDVVNKAFIFRIYKL